MATIIRQSYIDKIEKYFGKETIIVLVGQRRVGKSCMMKMIRDCKMTASRTCIFANSRLKEYKNDRANQLNSVNVINLVGVHESKKWFW